ncbi:MAG: NAD(P)H-hydrate dehydratase [Victivallales bacterium]|nr:NAD(P)H-hydrate dehydratase [Victivallales bacterium]
MKIVTALQMRDFDRKTIAAGTPGAVLMERAGARATTHIIYFARQLDPVQAQRYVILTGKGNNGGDGYVCARYLRQQTALPVVIYSACDPAVLQGDAARNAGTLPDGVTVSYKPELRDADFQRGDILIDGLLGTGCRGRLKPPFEQWIPVINRSGRPVIALDIPSGLNGDDGSVGSDAVRADLTITIGLPKTGLYLGHGPEYCGRLRLVDIGLPAALTQPEDNDLTMPFAADLAPRLGRLPVMAHKNIMGRVLVIGGSREYGGAPFLSAMAAGRAGAGYVRLALPRTAATTVAAWPSLVLHRPDDDGRGSFSAASIPEITVLLEHSDALVVGPGLGRSRSLVELLDFIIGCQLPTVWDADALNLIAELPELYRGRDNHILTPHPGEMKRLLRGFGLEEYLDRDRISQVRALTAAVDATVVLKGPQTVIGSPDGRLSLNSSGSPALAKAGSGDCLGGMIGTFAAQGMEAFEAAETAVFLHGLAAELSPMGMRALRPEDLLDLIPAAMKHLSPFA